MAPSVRTFHIACMPFPSSQGTQAWVRMMMEALGSGGDDPHLLVYAHGEGAAEQTPANSTEATESVPLSSGAYTVHRAGNAGASLRSGPSFAKVRADVTMARHARRLIHQLRPAVVVAHNVEAAWLCQLLARTTRLRWLYVAHTRMDTELPTYLPSSHAYWRPVVRSAGVLIDRVSKAAPATAAVSPALAAHVGGTFLPPPWPSPPAITAEERQRARAAHGLGGRVAVYVGNLDGYQGLSALRCVHAHGLKLVVATASDPRPLESLGVRRILPLDTEEARREVYALADIALVPRRAAGGLPVKLVDALARGVPVVTTHLALAGMKPAGVVAADTLSGAIAHALAPHHIEKLGKAGAAGRQWISQHASADAFRRAFRIACDAVLRTRL